MANENKTRDCPYCKEEIKVDAIKCKHCYSKVAPEHPDHGGVCPFCKEHVNPESIKCKYCGSQIGATEDTTMQSKGIGVGQDCFDRCYEWLIALGYPPLWAHIICMEKCQISMPWLSRWER